MAADEVLGQSELGPDLAHLVLEEIAQRLEQLQVHALGQAADVVMRLDQMRFARLRARGLDDVGIDGALSEPAYILDLLGLDVEDFDEQAADDLALLLGIGNAGERGQERLLGVDTPHVRAQVLREHAHDLITLVEAQQARVDEYADELVADRLVQQRRDDRRIDAARQTEQHAVAADLRADLGDVLGDDVLGRPYRRAAADVEHEAGMIVRPCSVCVTSGWNWSA